MNMNGVCKPRFSEILVAVSLPQDHCLPFQSAKHIGPHTIPYSLLVMSGVFTFEEPFITNWTGLISDYLPIVWQSCFPSKCFSGSRWAHNENICLAYVVTVAPQPPFWELAYFEESTWSPSTSSQRHEMLTSLSSAVHCFAIKFPMQPMKVHSPHHVKSYYVSVCFFLGVLKMQHFCKKCTNQLFLIF